MENTDFEIELQDIEVEHAIEEIELPKNFQLVGEIQKNDVRVYIKRDVYLALEKFAASDTTKELGSFLLGDYKCEKDGTYHAVISDYVEAKYTDAGAFTLTYTHETWNDYYEQKERLYPEKKLVGWQHTHPSYGVFLSQYDQFIQENTFNLPFQVAYVIDPIRGTRGFFAWKNGKINPLEPLKGYYVYDEK